MTTPTITGAPAAGATRSSPALRGAFGAIVRWELRTALTRVSTWVYVTLFLSLGFLLMTAAAGTWPDVTVAFGGGGKVYSNSPYAVTLLINLVALFGISVTAALAGHALYRDFETGAYPLFYTLPVSRRAFLGGRFTGMLVINLMIIASIGIGVAVAAHMPWVDPNRIGPTPAIAYFQPYLVLVLPNLFFTACLFFALVSLTRQMLPNYVGGAVLLIGYLIASSLAADLPNKHLAALIDPFGAQAVRVLTRYWSTAEQNTRLVPLTGDLLFNRLIWSGVGVAVLAFAVARFRFSHSLPSVGSAALAPDATNTVATDAASIAPSAATADAAMAGAGAWASIPPSSATTAGIPVAAPAPRVFGRAAAAAQFRSIFRRAFLGIVLNRYFAVIVGAGLLFLVIAGREAGKLYGTTTYPVTYEVEEIVSGTFGLFVLVLIAFYSGELVWAERDAGIHQMQDATPQSMGAVLLAKLAALCAVIATLLALTMLCGILTQAFKGYYRFEIPLYLESIFGIRLVDYILLAVAAMAVHVMINHKYLGHLVVLLAYIGLGLLPSIGLEQNLYAYASDGGSTYSDMNGFGPYLGPFFVWKLYWSAFAVLLVLVIQLFWVRGEVRRGRARVQLAIRRVTPRVRTTAAAAGFAFAGFGGFIYYNTNILNKVRPAGAVRHLRAEYEQRYKQYELVPQPRITAVNVRVELYPQRGALTSAGDITLRNKTRAPIDTVHLRIAQEVRIDSLSFDRSATRVLSDSVHEYYMYRLDRPLAPGDSMRLRFAIASEPRGFENNIASPSVAANGTFVSGDELAVGIGYAAGVELSDEQDRRKEHLPPRPRMHPPTDTVARRNMYVSSDADFIDFEAVVGTDSNQIAVAPGYLQREWRENGRRYFDYKMDSPMLPLWAVLSARYAVKRSTWHDVAIEVYYHPSHAYNVDQMIASVQKSLDYFTTHFGPYQHRQVRILEFPRYASFAQSLPNTIPYSEAIGFIARIETPQDIDYPMYVTAHEVAHQWWAHQVIGGDVAGATVLSETLAQYSALMVMEHEFGPAKMKRFLEYELDRYLAGRSAGIKEEPLALVENKPTIHYNKGSLAMYALRDYLGEDRLNDALARFLRATRFQKPPYTTSMELLDTLRSITPDSLKYVLHDLFETITLYELRGDSASATQLPDGRWHVSLAIHAKKMRADSLGAETDTTMNDWVDVGVYPVGGSPTKGTSPISLAKHRITTGPQTIEIVVPEKPGSAGIDPLNKLIDRDPKDNVIVVRTTPPPSSPPPTTKPPA
jgi:ABC-type transport system involved in multi-copper enzyme maturation permease subunit